MSDYRWTPSEAGPLIASITHALTEGFTVSYGEFTAEKLRTPGTHTYRLSRGDEVLHTLREANRIADDLVYLAGSVGDISLKQQERKQRS